MAVAGKASERATDAGMILGQGLDIDSFDPGPLATNQEPLEERPPEYTIAAARWRAN
jgi:hypothetical protein